MEIKQVGKDLYLYNVQSFNLSHIFDCGQCFRWEQIDTQTYIGVAYDRVLKISQNDNDIILFETSIQDYYDIWEKYLDLSRDYDKIKSKLSTDAIMKEAIEFGSGLRILNQEPWECIASFIISASNNIPRIKKIITALATNFGDTIEYMGEVYYTFPTAERIAQLEISDLACVRAGYRDKYILSAAKMIASNQLNLESIQKLPTDELKKSLMTISGVGNKVSDCILLFGMGRYDSFPVDVWIKRIIEYCYFQKEQTIRDIVLFSKGKFGCLGGFAQQYLFFYGREHKIGVK